MASGRSMSWRSAGGSQRSSTRAFAERLRKGGMQISMDGRVWALNHVFVARLWHTGTYEEV